MANIIHASGQFEFNDFWKTLLWYNLRKRWWLVAILTFIELCGLFVLIAKGYEPWMIFSLFCPVVIIGAIVFQIYSASNHALKLTDREIEYSFSITEYEVKTNSSLVQNEWSNLHQVQETEDSFLLFMHPNVMQPIPKRFFSSEEDITKLRDILRFALNNKVKLLK